MEKLAIENMLWKNVFEQPISEHIKCFVILIILFRILSLFPITKRVKPMVYLIKFVPYFIFIVFICVYFHKTASSYENINLLTGFTLIFCTVEVADNLALLFEEVFGKKNLYITNNKALLEKQEKRFCDLISILQQIQSSIKPGKVDGMTRKIIIEMNAMINKNSFYIIDSFLEMTTEKKNYFTSLLGEIRTYDIVLEAISVSDLKQEKFNMNIEQCETFILMIDKAIECKRMYDTEKSKFEFVNKNLRYIE